MSGVGVGSSSRVSMPEAVRKVIRNIREIAGNFSDDEVYAMLKDCNMDPNETVQKLLRQDSFHEVRRKRDKKKENNREPSDSRSRGGVRVRGGSGVRGSCSSGYADSLGRRKTSAGKENAGQGIEKSNAPDVENKPSISTSRSAFTLANGPTKVDHLILSQGYTSPLAGVNVITSSEENSVTETDKMEPIHSKPTEVEIGSEACESPLISDPLPSTTPLSTSGVYDSASDPALVPSFDSPIPGPVGTIKRETGSQQTIVEATINKGASSDVSELERLYTKGQESSKLCNSHLHGKMLSATSQSSDTSQNVSSSFTSPIGSRPSPNYSNQSPQLSFSREVCPSMEWKPKFAHVTSAQASGMLGTFDSEPSNMETAVCSVPSSSIVSDETSAQASGMLGTFDSEPSNMETAVCSVPSSSIVSDDMTTNLEKKVEDLKFSETQHVIIPHHLLVPESDRYGLSFGSFDSSFKLNVGFENGPACDKSTCSPSKLSHETEDIIEEPSFSMHNASHSTHKEDYADQPQSSTQTENQSSRQDVVSSSITEVPEYEQPKSEAMLASEGPQNSVVHTAPTYSTFGLIQPMFGSQYAPSGSTEPMGRDATHLPGLMVQQPFDPSASYYAQAYRPTAVGGDGHFSPLLAPGAVSKYNGNVAVAPQTSESPQETGDSLVVSSTALTSLTTQAAGVMQSAISVTPQPVPIFRQPSGLQISHYPANYLPYSQYFSPFFLPHPALHHFLSNTAFPQQPPTGSIYQPSTAAANPLKYSISQYKPGANTSNANHTGVPTGYGSYTTGYSSNPTNTSGNSTGNEDLLVSHYKDNGVFIPCQQPNSFYNLPPHGQHMAFAPNHVSPGSFSGVLHPLLQQSQATAAPVETVAPPTNIFQQPQPQSPQIDWANGY